MKSPFLLTVTAVALVFAGLSYFAASFYPQVDVKIAVAVVAFVAAFVAPFLSRQGGQSASTGEIKTLYVGNLPYRANEAAVRRLFADYGYVHSVRLMKDKQTGKRRGFGFVEMSASDADNAVSSLNDAEFQQRTLKVREAKERPEREQVTQ